MATLARLKAPAPNSRLAEELTVRARQGALPGASHSSEAERDLRLNIENRGKPRGKGELYVLRGRFRDRGVLLLTQ